MPGSLTDDPWIRRGGIILIALVILSLLPDLLHRDSFQSHDRAIIRTHIDTVSAVATVPMNTIELSAPAHTSTVKGFRISRLDTILRTDPNAVGYDTISIQYNLTTDSLGLTVRMSPRSKSVLVPVSITDTFYSRTGTINTGLSWIEQFGLTVISVIVGIVIGKILL